MHSQFYLKYKEKIHYFIQEALQEDIGNGDISSLVCIDKKEKGKARLVLKEDCIISGIELAEIIFCNIDKESIFTPKTKDGKQHKKGDIIFTIESDIHSILVAERLALNCMQHMSGISTFTHFLNKIISHTQCKILDTRKTTPNFRIPEKWGVKIGGGENHRMGLYDMIMLKDNHIDYCGGIEKTILKTEKYLATEKQKFSIIVETRNLKEVQECLSFNSIYRILLDNMDTETLKKAVQLINGKFQTEASGNIDKNNIVEIAETGVNFVSLGCITHSAKNIDMSLNAVLK